MPSITTIKSEREFYSSFHSLVNVLKTIAMSQFHSLERKIQTYEELIDGVESFFSMIDQRTVAHPFVSPKEGLPLGIIAVTSNRGLLGGLNHHIMTAAFSYMKDPHNQLIIVGQQGQNFVHGLNVFFKGFMVEQDNMRYLTALQIRDHVMEEVLNGRMGAVKIIYPFARSIQLQNVLEMDLLPTTSWPKKGNVEWNEYGEDILYESHPVDLVEYLVYLSMGQKIYEILQFARLAEEVGEVGRLLNHMYGSKPKKSDETKQELGGEIADVLFTLICLANNHSIYLHI